MPFIRKVQLPDFFTSILALVYHKQDIQSKETTNVVYEESHNASLGMSSELDYGCRKNISARYLSSIPSLQRPHLL